MDNETLTSAFAGIRQRLMMLAGRMLGNEDDAADAVQDAFCKLWQRRDTISSQNEVEGVSVVTVRNLCVDNLRRNTKSAVVRLDENRTEADEVESDEYTEKERKAAFDELNEVMRRNLSETQQRIVMMREYEGRSFEEIAELLDMQPATVRVQLSRARKMIREIYRNRI